MDLIFHGPNLLLEFNAGHQVPPFDYNGFAANLEFIEGPPTTLVPPSTHAPAPKVEPVPPFEMSINHPNRVQYYIYKIVQYIFCLDSVEWTPPPSPKFSPCDKVIVEANGRSGHFDNRGRPFASNCRLIFKGKPTDVVHISLFNNRLKAQSCRSVIEIVDGSLDAGHKKSLHKMCSPTIRHARNADGNFFPPQTFISTGSQIMVALRRPNTGSADYNDEFIDGAYMFHDGELNYYVQFRKFDVVVFFIEEQSGTLQPASLCDTDHYGLSSPSMGNVLGPGTEHLYWNIEGMLSCGHHFVPAANQSVIVTVYFGHQQKKNKMAI